MKQLSIFNAQKSTSSQILCCALDRSIYIRNSIKLGRKGLKGSQPTKATEIMTVSMESRLNSSATSSQDSPRCSSAVKSQIYWATWEKHQKLSQKELYLSHCSMTSLVTEKSKEEECLANARVVQVLEIKFGVGQWSFIGPGSEKKWYSAEQNNPQGAWDHIADEMLLKFAESGHPIFRATTPVSRCKRKS